MTSCPCCSAGARELCSRLLHHTQRKRQPQWGWCGADVGLGEAATRILPQSEEPLGSLAAATTVKDKEGEDGAPWVSPGLEQREGQGCAWESPWARACHGQEALPAPLLSDSAGPSPSPAPASPQSSQHQRGWNPPSSPSPRGWLLLPLFLPRPNQPLCWPPSKEHMAVLGGHCDVTVLMAGPGVGLAAPWLCHFTPLLSPGPVTPSPAPQLTWNGPEPVIQVGCRGLAGVAGPCRAPGADSCSFFGRGQWL